MHINSLTLKHFRCFSDQTISFQAPLVLLEGANGSGKTSLLEALHYACYLRSFRTRTTQELIQFGSTAFSLQVELAGQAEGTTKLTMGYAAAVQDGAPKRLVKVDGAPVHSYKDLVSLYRVVTMTDDDLLLITGLPEVRRSFLDAAITLTHPEHVLLTPLYCGIGTA
jgi:DNA replication and repair protein RecF